MQAWNVMSKAGHRHRLHASHLNRSLRDIGKLDMHIRHVALLSSKDCLGLNAASSLWAQQSVVAVEAE